MNGFMHFIRTAWRRHSDNRAARKLAGETWIIDRDTVRISGELAAIAAHR